MEHYKNKTILITGGTGSFGHAYLQELLAKTQCKKVIILSRDEMKQWQMQQRFNDDRVRFFIGDVRDKDRLRRAFKDVNLIVHAAATKIVPTAEYNPFECIKTNINGAMNVIDAAIDCGVEKVVALSTDKASSPINLYGATKLASDKLFIAANAYSADDVTKFSVVRYGNVLGSRGSVIPFFSKLIASGEKVLPITDERMTRFMITLEEGIDLVHLTFEDMYGAEIYVKKIPSMRVIEIAKALFPEAKLSTVGIRPGEKLHEQMIGFEDSESTYEYPEYYKILPQINEWGQRIDSIKQGQKVRAGFIYSSDNNSDWMSSERLRSWYDVNRDKMLKIGG